MKRQNFRASRVRGNFIQTKIKSREQYTETSAFSHNLMKRRRGGETEFKQGLTVENGTANRLLFFIII